MFIYNIETDWTLSSENCAEIGFRRAESVQSLYLMQPNDDIGQKSQLTCGATELSGSSFSDIYIFFIHNFQDLYFHCLCTECEYIIIFIL